MEISFNIQGNSKIKLLNNSISIKSGDFFAVFYVSASFDAPEVLAFLRFDKNESGTVNKYQEIYPLLISLQIMNKIIISIPKTLSVFIGGKTFFIEIKIKDIPNIPINISLVSSKNENLTILGSNLLTFNENKTINRFTLKVSNQANASDQYYIHASIINSPYSGLFELENQKITMKLYEKPKTLTPNSLSFQAKLKIYSKSIDLLINNLNFPVFIFYQIYQKLSTNSLEMSFDEIIERIDNASEYQIILENSIIGAFKCNDTSVTCMQKISNLNVTGYYLKCVAVSDADIQGNSTYQTYFEPYRKILNNFIKSLSFY